MEDFDEAEEMNEEDLLELGDPFGSIDLKVSPTCHDPQTHVLESLQDFGRAEGAEYLAYCQRQLTHDDQELGKKYLTTKHH
jgi:hypothetical protein